MKSILIQFICLLLIVYTLQVIDAAKQEDCPKPWTSSSDVICTGEYDPVKCGELECEYSNQCVANTASSNFTSETCNLINSQSTSATTSLNQEGSRYFLLLSLIAVMGVFAIGDLV
ncbi:predicted protein [Chaetoceros tenuissimus]|uniref:Kazal-like domain-containing protein n=1 Tax=Chaetoceros tenuissimus TaxID=426638 RepID=A0AAD3GZA8_9STRA|nr:predicted protein [Chaetoceros tenuissimus]